MRKLFLLSACAIATAAVLMTTSTLADAPKDSKDSKVTKAAKNPNYRWHNGQWWYWMSKQKNWVVWNGSQWQPYQQAQANRGAVRSFSYQAEGQAGNTYSQGVQRRFGMPLSTVPDSVANGPIIGSYGFHSAGSKALGNY